MAQREKGVSSHYLAASGSAYARWQFRAGDAMGVEKARRFAQFVRPADTVLDFGCGSGSVLVALRCGRRLGVEPNPAAARVAVERGIEVCDRLELVGDGLADVVISHHSLEHCLRPLDELQQMWRVSKQGGRLVLVVPIDDWRSQRSYRGGDMSHHLYGWTPQSLGNLIGEAGFEVERVHVITHAWPAMAVRSSGLLPAWAWRAVCATWSVLRRSRQLQIVARKTDASPG